MWNTFMPKLKLKGVVICPLLRKIMSTHGEREREREDKFEVWESGERRYFFVLRKKEKGIFFIALHVVEKLKKKEKKKVNSQTFHRSKGKNVSFGVLWSLMFYAMWGGEDASTNRQSESCRPLTTYYSVATSQGNLPRDCREIKRNYKHKSVSIRM